MGYQAYEEYEQCHKFLAVSFFIEYLSL